MAHFHHDPPFSISDLDNLDISPHNTYDDFHSPQFPATPSYNGSYQNSPYSGTSELDFDSKQDALGLFDNDPLVVAQDDYDPSAYDPPASSGLLMFDGDFMSGVAPSDHSHVSLSVTPADDHNSPYYDHPSPGSSNGGPENDRSSPASSVSSHPGAHGAPSPHLNFNNLHVDSPYLPSIQVPSERGSPQIKPQSPPTLLIPDGGSQPNSFPHQERPIINAPEGDGVGPRLHIVPATPVSGGGDASQSVAYQNPLISQGSRQSAATASWAHHQAESAANAGTSQQQAPTSGQYSSGLSYNFPPSQSQDQRGISADEDFLLPPSPSRTRAKSDTSVRPPQWALPQLNQPQNHQQHLGDGYGRGGGTVNLGDVLPPVSDLDAHYMHSHGHRPSSSASAIQTSFPSSSALLSSPGHNNSSLPAPFASFQNNNNRQTPDFLSPDFGAQALRRARSDGGGPRHTRQVRSEDFGTRQGYPPSQHAAFMQQSQVGQMQYLQPEPVPSITRGHHRRASSGSREAWSPYPSPNASPARGVEPLPNVSGLGGGRHHLVDEFGGGYGNLGGGGGGGGGGGRRAAEPIVAKPNVTTSATADASMKRRINDAKFVCPVPGCGSTFTRHFNLKGHLRSHNDEKPFQCKWPGCGKGFARQHDCKRHEQLHSNHRPFTCEGCKKPFARLDALNRHLRSEGGSGCAKAQEGIDPQLGLPFSSTGSSAVDIDDGEDGMDGPVPKMEPNWEYPNGLMM